MFGVHLPLTAKVKILGYSSIILCTLLGMFVIPLWVSTAPSDLVLPLTAPLMLGPPLLCVIAAWPRKMAGTPPEERGGSAQWAGAGIILLAVAAAEWTVIPLRVRAMRANVSLARHLAAVAPLRRLAGDCRQYASGHGGRYPPTLVALLENQTNAWRPVVRLCGGARFLPRDYVPANASHAAAALAVRASGTTYLAAGLTVAATRKLDPVILIVNHGYDREGCDITFASGKTRWVGWRELAAVIQQCNAIRRAAALPALRIRWEPWPWLRECHILTVRVLFARWPRAGDFRRSSRC